VKHEWHEVSPVTIVVVVLATTAGSGVIVVVIAITIGNVSGDAAAAATTIATAAATTVAAGIIVGAAAASAVITATTSTDEVMHLLRGHNSTLTWLQRQVATTTCREQIFAPDVIVVPRLFIALAICTCCRVVILRLFGSGQRSHRHITRKNACYCLRLGENVTKEFPHHVVTRIHDGVGTIRFVVSDVKGTTQNPDGT